MREIDIDVLNKHLTYNPSTGEIHSLTSRGNIKAGKKLGTMTGEGYMTIHVCGITLYFHRAAFALYHGYWPEMVDHVNGDKSDNRIANLRASNKTLNARNAKSKTPGRFRGACKKTNFWEVFIRSEGRQLYVGRFKTEVEAAYAYDMASLTHHGDHGRRNFLPFVV
jgi:hypothetical protein